MMTRRRGRSAEAGLTMVELMISATILVIVLLGFLMMLTGAMRLGEASREQNIVTFDINAVVGHVRRQPLESLTDPDYIGGPRIPHGKIVDPALYRQPGDPPGGQPHLPNQEIIVYYYTGTDSLTGAGGTTMALPPSPDPADATPYIATPFTTPDPLKFLVECTWTDQLGVARTENITCIRTR